jgi:hypothetical protein
VIALDDGEASDALVFAWPQAVARFGSRPARHLLSCVSSEVLSLLEVARFKPAAMLLRRYLPRTALFSLSEISLHPSKVTIA